jgi:outer membrane protein
MPTHGWSCFTIRQLVLSGLLMALGCRTTSSDVESVTVSPDPAGRAKVIAARRLAQEAAAADEPNPAAPDRVPVRPMGPPATTQPVSQPTPDQIEEEVPDPVDELKRIDALLSRTDLSLPDRRSLERLRTRVAATQRENAVRLSLGDAVRRALQNNYSIQVQSYNPAIDATQIVEAEARFDEVFFTSFNYNRQDRPTSSQLQGTQSDTRVFNGGIRKLLSTGTLVQASYALTRTKTNLSYQTLNPAYFNQFIVEFQQPLLRGFGLDFNRSQIEINRLNRRISLARLEREIRETLFNVERAYWRLLQARRSITVQARLLEELQSILAALEARRDYDVYPILLNQTSSRIQLQEAQFIQAVNNMRSAEVFLKGLLNDPTLNQAVDVDIIPTDTPSLEPIMLDQLGELSAALTHRAELHEARLAIEQAQIAIGVAKNQALPRLDLLFRYIVDGLGGNPSSAFSQMSNNDFNEYVVGLEFEWPIGNRGPEAAIRRARLQQAQAIAAHRAQIELVITEVKQILLDLQSTFEQVGPNFRAARAAFDQLRATRAKIERRDPANLNVELTANQDLASARLGLLDALVSYNINIIDLERRKGTLLRYNNVVICGAEDEAAQKPYRPSSSGWGQNVGMTAE